MVVRRKKTRSEAHDKSAINPQVVLKEGDWLDVMDGDDVWNVARVLSVPSPEEVEITYDGWTKEYDEIVQVDSNRVAPYHTFTWTVKCWVKYLNWPLWPSIITIRTPGTPVGIRNLAAENRLFVDFLDNPNFAERDRCWQKKQQVQHFYDDLETKQLGSTGKQFERALGWILQSDASTTLPKFTTGTLPFQYQHSPVESVAAIRKKMGDEQWFERFTINQPLHKQRHVYETLGYRIFNEENDTSSSLMLKEKSSTFPAANKKSRLQTNASSPITTHIKASVSCEVDQMNSDSDFQTLNDRKDDCQKRRRLRTERRSDNVKARLRKKSDVPTQIITAKALARQVKKPLKGRTLMADRRSVTRHQILNLAKNNEPIQTVFSGEDFNDNRDRVLNEIQSADNLVQRSEELKDNEQDTSSGKSVSKSSRTLSKRVVKRQLSDERRVLLKKKDQTTRNHTTRKQPRIKRSNLSTEATHKNSQPIKSRRSVVHNANKGLVSSGLLKAIDSLEEKSVCTRSKLRQRSMELDSLPSVGEDKCSVGSESNDDTHRNRGGGTSKKSLKIKNADAQTSAVKVVSDQQKHSKAQVVGINGDGKIEDSQSQRFCVMQADKSEASRAENRDKPRLSKKTAISVPRKFCVTPAPRTSGCFTNNSTSCLAPPPELCLPTSSGQACSTLNSSTTAIFSSSEGFSVESWFKRKLMADFQCDA